MSFEEIYKTYWQKIFRLCMGYVNDADWAKDIAQDTFVTVYQQLGKFRQESAVSTWVFRIAVNHCLRQIAQQKKFSKTDFPKEIEDKAEPDKNDELELLYRCIAELEETDRLLIGLDLEGVKQAEIASILGFSEGNVRVKIHRIKEKLTKKFQQHERTR